MGVYAGPDVSESGLVLALDAANKKSYSQNEFQYSTDIFAWSGNNANNATLSRDTIGSPVGNTPLKMAVTGNDPYLGTYNSATWNIAPAANGQTWVVSVYAKADVATTGQIFIFGANSSGTGFVDGAWLAITAVTVNIGTEWTRVSHYLTMNNASIAYIHARLDGPDSGGTGQTIWWDGLQVERVPSGTTTPTPFISSYYGGNVFKDLSGRGNTGTLTNYPTYNQSDGGIFVFDGVDDYITNNNSSFTIANNLFADSNGSWSVSAWFKFPVSPTQSRSDALNGGNCSYSILGRSGGIGGGATFVLFVAGASTINGIYPNKCVASIRGANNPISDTLVNTNTWYNAVVTWNGSVAYGYLNASPPTSLGVGSAGLQTYNVDVGNTASLNTPPTGYHNFEGSISNVQIYNRALTSSEVQQNFNALRKKFGV